MATTVVGRSRHLEIIASPKLNATEEDKQKVEEFIQELMKTVSWLENLLETPSIWTDKKFNVFKKILNEILNSYEKADGSWFRPYFALRAFCRDLENLKVHSKAKYYKVRKKLVQARSTTSWYGLRTELRVFDSLLIAGIDFEITDPPDVTLKGDFSGLFIEITSCRFTTQTEAKSPLYKIDSAINKKQAKSYASRQTILVIDITDVWCNESQDSIFDISALARRYAAEQSVFGAIVFFVTSVTNTISREHSAYGISYSENEVLRELLGRWLPQMKDGPVVLECSPGYIMC